ncbi:MAG TPA: hypothetical protein VG317_16000 [Pseudonocardiaceae bacterium]|jgi:hypothetical protein|nr:hypothetical protein [Pseudonocardiaceae bacterium]
MDDTESAARWYRDRLGWPVFAVGSIVWTTPGIAVSGLNVPADVGERVVVALRAQGVQLPAVSVGARWILLGRADSGERQQITELVEPLDVGVAMGGRDSWGIDLPPTQHPGHPPLSWVSSPEIPLPALMIVAQAVLAAGQ